VIKEGKEIDKILKTKDEELEKRNWEKNKEKRIIWNNKGKEKKYRSDLWEI
jgi:hypothetical protein